MGCSGSKEKKAPPAAPAQPAPVERKAPPPVEAPKEVVVAVKEEPKKEAAPPPWLSRLLRVETAKKSAYRYVRCDVEGAATSFFPPRGLCYRVEQGDTWLLYNDTLNYEMHVRYQFSPDANVTPLGRATAQSEEDGSTVVSVVVYPLETVEFVGGEKGSYKADVSAQALSDEYRQSLRLLTRAATEELQRVSELASSPLDDEALLLKCLEATTPYVDLSFAPSERMFCRPDVDGRLIPATELRRATECHGVNPNAVDAIRGAVIPQCVDSGLLCDNWLMCAVTALAEDEERVKEMFALCTPAEKRLGAYRLLLNKNGWWKPVLVDDFLPTVNAVPCFARVLDDPAELWVSLLQKAYAKLHGSYASITGGDAAHALRDFTGAPSYRFDEAWVAAAQQRAEVQELLDKLTRHLEEGNMVLLSTPAATGAQEGARNGLRAGYTYSLKAVRQFPDSGVTLLNLRNPWEPAEPWTGEWCAGSSKWETHKEVRSGCNPDFSVKDGSFWMEWAEAAKEFDGCGVVFLSRKPVYDYRVRGEFSHVQPSVVFMVRAAEPVEVMLTLTQQDKRGVPLGTPEAKLSPMMLSVSRGEGNKQRVDKNSSADPEAPSEAFTFVVAREVAMTYTFEPSAEPYFVVPRIHRKGTSEGRQKAFVLGVRSATPLEGKLDIQFTELAATNPVLQNRVQFVVEDPEEVIRPLQTKLPGEAVVTSAGSRLSTATIPERPHTEPEEAKKEEAAEEEELAEEAAAGKEAAAAEVEDANDNPPLPHDEQAEEERLKKAKMNGAVDAGEEGVHAG
ncbi:cytoskeleton-associated protein CAP5.5 [Trypanosoma conorhini]|uniref:Cytoskeleton-associated protein CAP5.5 n=1 Tax=Trypanosoma conorhini TaxID=83891 RepID=A0A422Q8T9_9TRYP|nr:cytoskeleton-associated protein CAP5.5 [Trypanosoma conorhini]RNF26392.1 cytoskeleton-associated protein CAP5.5 [Trypanosoma conorhini]